MKDRVPHKLDPELQKKVRGLNDKQIALLTDIYSGIARELRRVASLKPSRKPARLRVRRN